MGNIKIENHLENFNIKLIKKRVIIKEKFEELATLKKQMDKICVCDVTTWRDRILLESIADSNFLMFAKKVFCNVEKMNSDELDNCFQHIINQAEPFMEKYKNAKNIIEKYNFYLKIERYFGIIEQLDEISTISENIYKELINKYGYEKFIEIEKSNPSVLTNFYEQTSKTDYSEDIKKYLVLKKWQDKQNIYMNKVFENELNSAEIEDEIFDTIISKIDVKTTMRRKFELYKILKNDYIDIDYLSKLYIVGLLDNYKPVIGGKAYGLAILNCYCNIPATYIVSYQQKGNIEKILNELNVQKRYAIRSSADCEDSASFSFAGMFDTLLNVKKENVLESIIRVKDSVNSERVCSYVKINNLQKPKMNVIIQEFVSPDFAGVWMGSTINSGVYEIVEGCGDELVSGKKTPQIFNFDKNNTLSQYFVALQKSVGSKCDLEFCIKDNALTMLQCRPVTTNIKKQVLVKDGIGASCGTIKGEICFLDNPQKKENFKEGSILLTFITDPEWVPIIQKAKGIITLNGGYLCHTAIISRELNKPCIVGVNKDLFNKLKNAKEVVMNGENGEIKICDVANANTN